MYIHVYNYLPHDVCFCSVETESLGPLLGQIVVALCPFVEKYTEQVSAMFEFFIIENRQAAGSR